MQQSVQQSATLTGRPAARRRAPRLVGLLALVLLVLALALPAGAAASAAPPMISVTAPTGSASYAQYDSLTVSWTTSSATASGEFCVWLRSSSGGWYAAKLWPAGGGTSFGTSLVLDVPAGSGYQAIVAWRPTAGSGAWVSWGTSPGSFIVTAIPAPVITVTAPWGNGAGYPVGSLLTVSWTTSRATASGEFCVWARSAADDFYIAKLWPAGGGTSFSTFLVLDVPAGFGYQAIVAWRPTAGSGAWVSWGTSPGSFIVTASPPPADTFTITSSVIHATAGDSISPDGVQTVSRGGSMTFTIRSDYRKRVGGGKRGYYAWTLTVDGVVVSPNVNTYTFANVIANHTIVADFTDR